MPNRNISRFLGRAENYDRYRPRYAPELFDYLHRVVSLKPTDAVADIAAGTGIFTEQMAAWGNRIYVVEPNEQMMAMAKNRLLGKPHCIFSSGTAEASGLAEGSIRLILAAQAFHWFDPQQTKEEFLRIGVEGAYTGIVWNKRRTDSSFERGYEDILQKYGTDYLKVSHSAIGLQEINAFFSPPLPEYEVFPHTDWLTLEALRGRIASYSFMPEPTSPAFEDVESAISRLFELNQMGGVVSLSYDTKLHLGQLRR